MDRSNRAVGDETSGHNVEPDRINRGQSMPGRECGGQVARYDGQRYVAVAETRKIANTRELAIQVDGPQKGRTGDLVVVDVIDPHTACAGVFAGIISFLPRLHDPRQKRAQQRG